jgi:hypothetical protein
VQRCDDKGLVPTGRYDNCSSTLHLAPGTNNRPSWVLSTKCGNLAVSSDCNATRHREQMTQSLEVNDLQPYTCNGSTTFTNAFACSTTSLFLHVSYKMSRSAPFWESTQRRVVVSYRLSGTAYWCHLQGSCSPREKAAWPLKFFFVDCWALERCADVVPKRRKETTILRCVESRKERISHLRCSESLKSTLVRCYLRNKCQPILFSKKYILCWHKNIQQFTNRCDNPQAW